MKKEGKETARPELTYEQAMDRLEQLVAAAERNETSIDALADSLQEAQQLIASCKEKLFNADKKIKDLLENG